MTVLEARDLYLAANGYSTAAYTDPKFAIPVAGIRIRLPNPGLLHLHDLHHVVTGYDNSLVGEGEISAFELRGGCGKPLVGFLCVSSIAIALLLSPRRIWRAWRRARGTRSLYSGKFNYEELLTMDVAALRQLVGLEKP